MAKSVKINNITYPDCPAVDIPLAEGNDVATFYDISDTTLSGAGQLPSGVKAHKADGELVTGNVPARTSSDMTASGATVTAPAGFYSESASKSVASGSAATPATTITANPSIAVSSSGLVTASVSASQSITPTVSAGYVSAGTSGTVTVSGSGTEQLTTQAAQNILPSTTAQTIPAETFLTGTQTILAVTTSGLSASNIANGVTVKIGCSADDDCVASVTGTMSSVVVSQDSTTKVLSIS